ncbi:MAG: hypothetical protein LBH15_07715, partial [Treponema sp.]|nr:hypothetical protein [Treponema sp.]
AREEGYGKAAHFFEEAALNEQEHAKIWFKLLDGIGETTANLQTAADGEKYESTEMYTDFAKTAREEGFDDIAKRFEQIGAIEKVHEERYLKLLDEIRNHPDSSKTDYPVWKCTSCGHIETTQKAPSACSVCSNADVPYSGYRAFTRLHY